MAVTILEALQNAQCNINQLHKGPVSLVMAKEQLSNAVTLLEKGYSIDDEVEPILEKYGSADKAPDIS